MKAQSRKSLTIQYISALLLVAIMILSSHLILERVLGSRANSAMVLNISGRQRMLSQRIASMVLQYELGDQTARTDTLQATGEFGSNLEYLTGPRTLGRQMLAADPALENLYYGGRTPLAFAVPAYIRLAQDIVAAPPRDPAVAPDLKALLAQARAPLLNQLDAAVIECVKLNEHQLARLGMLQDLSRFVMLFTLGLAAFGIFRPMTRSMMEYTTELERLAEEREPFQLIVNSATEYAIVMLDPNGHVLTWNTGAARIKGYTSSEILGRHFGVFYPEEDIAAGLPSRGLQTAADQGRFETEGWRVRKDGSRFWANVTITVLRGEAGEIRGFGKVVRDLTERKAVEDTLVRGEARFRKLIEASPKALVMAGHDGRIEMVNTTLETLSGYTRTELIGEPIAMLLPARFRSGYASIQSAFLEAANANLIGNERNLFFLRKDGTECPIELAINPIDMDTGEMVLAIITDISERVHTQQLLREQAQDLQRSNQDLEQYAYTIAHDLRAPLRSIRTLSGWIKEDIGDECSPEVSLNLSRVEVRTARLESMLEGLLRYSKAGRDRGAAERVDTTALVTGIVESLPIRPGLTVEIKAPLPVFNAVRPPLEHVLQNLIGNALKHHDRNEGHVVVSCRDLGKQVEFTVADDGPGVAATSQHRIFELFQELKRSKDGEVGGVGLAIAKKAVEANGGNIRVASDPARRGAEFVFTWEKMTDEATAAMAL